MKYIATILCTLFCATFGYSQKTYAGDIAEIMYKKCSTCHRPGEIGPMALTNYEEVKAWGTTIKYVTSNNIMPPWQPDPNYSHFLDENYLTDEEIQAISSWVDGDMPRGDVAEEPQFPDFPEGSVLGEPDLVITMDEAWLHKGNNKDDYRYFVFSTDFAEDKIIKSIEFRPGNSKIVHHALIFEDRTGQAAANDASTPEYGFNGFGSFTGGGIEETLEEKQYPAYAPGQKPIYYPDGIGDILHAGADLVMQVHYAPWPVNETDQSTMNIFFMDEEETFEREVKNHIMVPLPQVIGEVFYIPANEEKTFHGRYTVPKDVSLINIFPHMHLLGKYWDVWAEKPDGEVINLIKINEWDFSWQGTYHFNRYIHLPAGSVIHAVATYDNTIDNPNNPSNPPQLATWGENTTDEMFYLPIGYVDYLPGDKDIILDETTVSVNDVESASNYLYAIAPNPVNDMAVVGFNLARGQQITFELYDIQGNRIRTIRKSEFYNMGEQFVNFSTKQLSVGLYILKMSGNGFALTQQFVKQ